MHVAMGSDLVQTIVSVAPGFRGALVEAGALAALVAHLNRNLRAEGGAIHLAVDALESLCQNDATTADLAFEAGALEPLLVLFKRQDADARESAMCALAAMMAPAKREHKDRAMAGGAVRLLSANLSCPADVDSLYKGRAACAALAAFFSPAERLGEGARYASFVDEILEGCSPARILEMLGAPDRSNNAIILLTIIALSSGHHRQLVQAGLPCVLVGKLKLHFEEFAPLVSGATTSGIRNVPGYNLLAHLLDGPEAVAAASAVVAAGWLTTLVAALGRGGEVGSLAAEGLLEFSRLGATKTSELVTARAVPRLLAAVSKGEREGPGPARAAAFSSAHALMNMMNPCGALAAVPIAAAVARDVFDAGFDVAQLRRLCGTPGD